MIDLQQKDYIAIVQCDIVKEKCSGFLCEKAFHERIGGFSEYAKNEAYRTIYMTCGGCCGRALHRKLSHLARLLKKRDGVEKDRIVVQLSTCITQDNYHGPPCPHLDYLKTLISRLGLDVRQDTFINKKSEELRGTGVYQVQQQV